MSIHGVYQERIDELISQYRKKAKGKAALLQLLDEAEISEQVYNSNAIENSTLTLQETEKILLELAVSRDVSVREVFEAKNLARVMEYVTKTAPERPLDKQTLLLVHHMLLTNISDDIAGRFRTGDEYVRIGTYIAPPPEQVASRISRLFSSYKNQTGEYFLHAVVLFHLEFETIHPFCDGNGRIGRVVMNYHLAQQRLPAILIRDNEKQAYYDAFKVYQRGDKTATAAMGKVVALAFLESLHKRLAYLEGKTIVTLAEYAQKNKQALNGLSNKAKRQTIAAFRERGVWKIGV